MPTSDLAHLTPRPSSRVPSPCRYSSTCGGCDWLDVEYGEQRRLKQAWVRQCLSDALDRDVDVGEVVSIGDRTSPPFGFRRKVHFVFGRGPRGELTLGHYARASTRVVAVRECLVHAEAGNAVAWRVLDELTSSRVCAYPDGPLRHLVIRVSSGGHCAATLVVADDRDKRLRAAARQAAARLAETGTSLAVNVNNRPGPYLFGDRTIHLGGPRHLVEHVGGVRFQLSATSFFQTNVDIAERLLLDLRRWCTPRPQRIVDFYAGVGLFALPLAADGHEVTAVEEHPQAVADALATRRANRLACAFIRGAVDRELVRLRGLLPASVDILLLDPPRAGCGVRVLRQWLAHLRPARVAYVSCEPTALARDLQGIVGREAPGGYAIESVTPYDMFPHTRHVETLVTLTQSPAVPQVRDR